MTLLAKAPLRRRNISFVEKYLIACESHAEKIQKEPTQIPAQLSWRVASTKAAPPLSVRSHTPTLEEKKTAAATAAVRSSSSPFSLCVRGLSSGQFLFFSSAIHCRRNGAAWEWESRHSQRQPAPLFKTEALRMATPPLC